MSPTTRARSTLSGPALALAVAVASQAAAGDPVGWRMDGSGAFPLADPPLEWSTTRNVAWATPMPSWSNSSPVLVKDRVLVSSEPDTLVCVRKADGALLWQRANPLTDAIVNPSPRPSMLDAMTATAKTQELLAAKEIQLTTLRQAIRRTGDATTLQMQANALEPEIETIRHQLGSLALHTSPGESESAGLSTPTPTTDGSAVFVAYGTGVVASYDLDGRRQWIRFADAPQMDNGAAASPVLVNGSLIVPFNDLIALDAATGALRWRASIPYRPGTPVVLRIGDEDVVVTPSGHCVRVTDGTVLASGLGNLDFASPVARDGVLYMIAQPSRALRIPTQFAEPLVFEPLWTARVKGERYYASPLIVDGLIYAVTRSQILNVLDASSGEQVYATRLKLGWTGAADSVFSSPTLGGKHVFISGFSGTTAVIQLGRTFNLVASNELEKFRSSLAFENKRIYVRGSARLWCLTRSQRSDQPNAIRVGPSP